MAIDQERNDKKCQSKLQKRKPKTVNGEHKKIRKSDESNKKEQTETNNKQTSFKINMINIQGLTQVKVHEIESIIENECDIIALTETQLKMDKITYNKNVANIDTMRSKNEKKGGGITILHKKNGKINLNVIASENNDILDVRGKIENTKIRIISVYLLTGKSDEVNNWNRRLKSEIEKKITQRDDDEALIIMGDFNGHTGFLGYQELDKNGEFVMELMHNHNLILLNNDTKCEGLYTWSRDNQKSVIDYMLVNKKMYDMFIDMKIDENKETIDISDHNMLTAKFKIAQPRTTNTKKKKWDEREYYKLDDISLQNYAEEVEQEFQTKNVRTITEVNATIKEVADKHLKKKYRRKITDEAQKIKEPPWMNETIRKEIKKRKELNRTRRNETIEERKREHWTNYLEQKKKVQSLIKEEIYKHEEKITDEIKKSTNTSKKLYDNIKKLQRREIKKDVKIEIYNNDGQKMNGEQAEKEIKNYWETIYQKHENKISTVWNETTKREYIANFNETGREENIEEIKRMEHPKITTEQVKNCLKNLKNNKAPGPDELNPELYKCLTKRESCMEIIGKSLQQEIDKAEKPNEWKMSKTKMIPKNSKPTPKDLRPIALTNISYKVFMKIVGEKIEEHITLNGENKNTQSGFTKGSRIEDNLFILQYCIENTFFGKKQLIVTSIDFSKAFDSIKREKFIQALMKHKIHHTIIDAIANIYTEDGTMIKIGEKDIEMDTTSGIKQGCTGSTVLFKLITYIIINELEIRGRGFKHLYYVIYILFFADDGLILSESIEDAENDIKTVIEISRECGLEINKQKSNIIIFNMKEKPNEIENIKVTDRIKYLGITVCDKKDCFKVQKEEMLQKAQKLANMTYPVIAKSCNKLLIGKTYWKSIALPSILYGTNVMQLTDTEIGKLQTIENSVYRQILGAPKYATNATLRGEIGASSMRKRIIESRLKYMKSIDTGRNRLLISILCATKRFGRWQEWFKTTQKYVNEINQTFESLEVMSVNEIKRKLNDYDTERWKNEINTKSSIKIYKDWKKEIKEEPIYDNRPESITLYRARANCLPLMERNRHTGENTQCPCGEGIENLEHMLLQCQEYNEIRILTKELQRPYNEKPADVIGSFLFDTENIEEKKAVLHKIWRKREARARHARDGNAQ